MVALLHLFHSFCCQLVPIMGAKQGGTLITSSPVTNVPSCRGGLVVLNGERPASILNQAEITHELGVDALNRDRHWWVVVVGFKDVNPCFTERT